MSYEERLQRMRQATEGKRRKRWLFPKRGNKVTALAPLAVIVASLTVGRFLPDGPIHDLLAIIDFAVAYWIVNCPMPGRRNQHVGIVQNADQAEQGSERQWAWFGG